MPHSCTTLRTVYPALTQIDCYSETKATFWRLDLAVSGLPGFQFYVDLPHYALHLNVLQTYKMFNSNALVVFH